MSARDEYRSLLADQYRDAIERAQSVAGMPGATVADVIGALAIARRPLVAFELDIEVEPTRADDEPTSPGRPSPLRAADPAHTEVKK